MSRRSSRESSHPRISGSTSSSVVYLGNQTQLTAAMNSGNGLMTYLNDRCADSGERTTFDQINTESSQLAGELERLTLVLQRHHVLHPSTAYQIDLAVRQCVRLLNRVEALTSRNGDIATLVARLGACVNHIHMFVSAFEASYPPAVRQEQQAQLQSLHAHFQVLVQKAYGLRAALGALSAYVG